MTTIIKNILRRFNIIILKVNDIPIITSLKDRFAHSERSFFYNGIKHLVDSLDFEASPGVAESIIMELERVNTKNSEKLKLINLGSGSGQASDIYRQLGFDVYSLDLRTDGLDDRNAHFDLNENKELPFSDQKFDVVVCQEVIEHIENPWKLFRHAKQLLKPSGIFIVSTPNVLSFYSRILFLITGHYHWFQPKDYAYHINPIPVWEMGLIANKVGFNRKSIIGNGDYFMNRGKNNEKHTIRRNEILIMAYQHKDV